MKNNNLEDIKNDFEVTHFKSIPDGTLHYHSYIEIELIESGNGSEVINNEQFNISEHSISIMRPYIDKHSIVPQGTEIIEHSINFKKNTKYNVKCGSMRIVNGKNKDRVYLFLSVDGEMIAEKFLDEDFSCESLSFFAKYATGNIQISENNNFVFDTSDSKILSSDDEFAKYDFSSNIGLGLDKEFVLDPNDLTFYQYNKSECNTNGSFLYSCDISMDSIGYRIITFKLNGTGKEINFLISTDKVYIAEISKKNEISIYKLCLNTNIIDSETNKKLLSFNNPLCVRVSDETYENMKKVFELLLHFYNQKNVYDKAIVNLIDILLRLFFDENMNPENTNKFKERIFMFFIDNNNFLNEITLKDFAEYLGYEMGYASRLCIKYTGYSFVKYKIYLRLQYAKHLISSTTTPIAEISLKSGFNSLSVFNRFFKKDTGYSPSEYRSLNLKNTDI